MLSTVATVAVAAPSHTLSPQLTLYHELQQRLGRVADGSAEAIGLRLLLAQLYSRMNMLQAAAGTLDGITGDGEVLRLRDMGWLLLLRGYQQRGEWARADSMQEGLREAMAGPLEAERRQLLARAALQRNDRVGALQHYRAVQGEGEAVLLARLNRAALLLRSGREEHGLALLQGLGEGHMDSPSAFTLQDRANLLLGYHFLQRGDHRAARQFLQRLRLQSPYRRAALLALGWSELSLQGAEYAIAPWMELLADARGDSLEDEARLAVAAAVASKGASPRVILHYRQLLVHFENRRTALREQQQFLASNPSTQQLAAQLASSPMRGGGEAPRVLRQLLALQRELAQPFTPQQNAQPFLDRLLPLLQEVYNGSPDSSNQLTPDAHVAQQFAAYLQRHHQRAPSSEGAGDYSAALGGDRGRLEGEIEAVAQWYRHSQLDALQRQDAQLDAYMERARLAIARSHDYALGQQVGE